MYNFQCKKCNQVKQTSSGIAFHIQQEHGIRAGIALKYFDLNVKYVSAGVKTYKQERLDQV